MGLRRDASKGERRADGCGRDQYWTDCAGLSEENFGQKVVSGLFECDHTDTVLLPACYGRSM